MSSDIRVGLRLLWKDKAFTLTALLTLALCIGANTALFSVVHNVLLRPLPVPESDRIVQMGNAYPGAGVGAALGTSSGVPDYYDRLRETDVFEEQALYNGAQREHRSERHAGSRPGDPGDAVVLPAAARRTGARPRLHGTGRRGRQRKETDSELRVLAVPVWRRSRRHRQRDPPRRPAVHGRRHHAEGLLFPQSRRDALAPARVHGAAEVRRAASQQQLSEHRQIEARRDHRSARSSRSMRSTSETWISFRN